MDLEKACSTSCLLRSLVVHAAGEPGVDMTRTQSLCAHLKRSRGAAWDHPWFSDECVLLRRQFREVVRTGQAVHACKEARKLNRASVRRSKRAHGKHLKAVFLDKLHPKKADLHSMLRLPQRTHPSTLTKRGRLT